MPLIQIGRLLQTYCLHAGGPFRVNYFNFAVSETGLLCDQFQKKTGGRQRGFVPEPDLRGKLFPYASRSFAHGLELTSLILDGKVVSKD